MAVIAIYSVKGGVGKTTLAANLAWCSATISCRRTLLWDLDAAGGAGFLLGIEPHARRTAGAVIAKATDPARLIRKTRTGLGLSQTEFAERFRVPVGTLRDWEQARATAPDFAIAYVRVIGRHPDLVAKAVA